MNVIRMVPFAVLALLVVACDSGTDEEPGIDLSGRILVAEVVQRGQEELNLDLQVRDARTGEVIFEDRGEDGANLSSPRLSPDGRHVVYLWVSNDDPFESRLASANLRTGDRYLSPPISVDVVGNPTWSPDGTRVATAGDTGMVVLDAEMELQKEPQDFGPPDSSHRGGDLPWSEDSQYVAWWNESGVLVGDRDGDLVHVDMDALAEPPPKGVRLDEGSQMIWFAAWERSTLRLIMVHGRGSDRRYYRADGSLDGDTISWEEPVETANEEIDDAYWPYEPGEQQTLREEALALAAESPDDSVAAMLQSADGSTWVAAIRRPGAQTERYIKIVVLSYEPIVWQPQPDEVPAVLFGELPAALDLVVVPDE